MGGGQSHVVLDWKKKKKEEWKKCFEKSGKPETNLKKKKVRKG